MISAALYRLHQALYSQIRPPGVLFLVVSRCLEGIVPLFQITADFRPATPAVMNEYT